MLFQSILLTLVYLSLAAVTCADVANLNRRDVSLRNSAIPSDSDGYHFIALLGKGDFGSVYKASNSLGSTFAIKVPSSGSFAEIIIHKV
jgi:hypothetical protein